VIPHEIIMFAGEATKHPAVSVGRRVLRGPDDWGELVWHGTPGERAAVLRHLGGRELLTVTPHGRQRLRRWLELTRQNTMFPPTPPIYASLGDAAIVQAALERVPRPVRDMIAIETNILAAGPCVKGTFGPPPVLAGRWLIHATGASEADLLETTVHEIGHFWMAMPYPADHVARTASEQAEVYARARAAGYDVDGIQARTEREHKIVDVLMLAWGAS
jgi:hypothetical protein